MTDQYAQQLVTALHNIMMELKTLNNSVGTLVNLQSQALALQVPRRPGS
jgi:hypothetical protein